MFKKQLASAGESAVGAKERKKLKKTLCEQFDPVCVEKLFQWVDQLFEIKFLKSKVIVYTDGTDPLFADTTSKGDLLPSLYCLQMLPGMIRCAFTARPETAEGVGASPEIKASDLDSASPLPAFKADEVCALVGAEPLAVFAAACSDEQFQAEKPELLGYLLHHRGDQLWQLGSGKDRARLPLAAAEDTEESEESAEEEDSQATLLGLLNNANKAQRAGAPALAAQAHPPSEKAAAAGKKPAKKAEAAREKDQPRKPKRGESPVTKPAGKGAAKEAKKPAGEAARGGKEAAAAQKDESGSSADEQPAAKVSPVQMDKLIREALLNCIALRVNDKSLPLAATAFWKDYVQPCTPPGTALDLAASSFKKLNKFCQHAAREGLIDFSDATQKGVLAQVTKVHRNHKAFDSFEPTAHAGREKEEKGEEGARGGLVARNRIENVCRPMATLRKYLGGWEGEHLSPEELRKTLRDSLKALGLLAKDDVLISPELDRDFALELLSAEPEEPAEEGEPRQRRKAEAPRLKFEKFLERIKGQLESGFNLVNAAGEKSYHRGRFEGVKIFAEKVHNKAVARVTGLSLYGFDMDEVLKAVCAQLSVTGHLSETAGGKLAQKELVVNAALVDELKDFVEQRLRLGEGAAEIVNKLERKKKKGGKEI